MSDYACSVPFFRDKILFSGTHTEFPSQTNPCFTVFDSSQLAHFLLFTVSINWLYHESFFLQGVSQREHSSRSAGISTLYSKPCCQEAKTSFKTSKATISCTVFRTWTSTTVQPYTDSSWSTHFCLAQTNKGALCSHRMVCEICSEYRLPSHCESRCKNSFSSSAGFPLPFFKLTQFLTFNLLCCYGSICILPVHTALSPDRGSLCCEKL